MWQKSVEKEYVPSVSFSGKNLLVYEWRNTGTYTFQSSFLCQVQTYRAFKLLFILNALI